MAIGTGALAYGSTIIGSSGGGLSGNGVIICDTSTMVVGDIVRVRSVYDVSVSEDKTVLTVGQPLIFEVAPYDYYKICRVQIISGVSTEIGGVYTTIDVGQTFHTMVVPDGTVVLPTNDVQTWLACGGYSLPYTTLNEVLADTTTLQGLLSNHNAIDYLVRSTNFASTLANDSNAMNYIGLVDYSADTLLANATWRAAICDSNYFQSVLNVCVPTMTSATAPSGEVTASGTYSGAAYAAFNGVWTSGWHLNANNGWLQYKFTNQMTAYKAVYQRYSAQAQARMFKDFNILGSVNGVDFDTIATGTFAQNDSLQSVMITAPSKYMYYRLRGLTSYTTETSAGVINFYGRR